LHFPRYRKRYAGGWQDLCGHFKLFGLNLIIINLWGRQVMRYSFLLLLFFEGCVPQNHFIISNDNVSFEDAKHDLNYCRLEAAKSTGAAPVDSSIYMVGSWQINKNEITSLCLKDKGYSISQTPPAQCVQNCDGNTEIVSRN